MNIQWTLALLFGGLAAGLLLTFLVLRAGQRWQFYVHPNARSSHRIPTPGLGGVAFVLPVLGYLAWLAGSGEPVVLVLAAGGLLLAAVGFWDDLRELGAPLRLMVHAGATALFLAAAVPYLPWPLLGLLGLALLWHVNLYNFMDGIDGLAAVQCLVFCVGAQFIGSGVPGWTGDLMWLLSGSVLGFLVFNWPPARIFMGDVGSGFLGLLIGAIAVLLWQQQALVPPAVVILLTGFWCDATYTLVVRFATGQAFTQAHRSHLYQKLAARRGHRWTTAIFLIYAIFWLVPLAWLSSHFPNPAAPDAGGAWAGWLWVVVAALPLLLAAVRFRAGFPDTESADAGSPDVARPEADRVHRHD